MGLGKTVQALGLIREIYASRILVVCPASLKLNWDREAKRWLPPGFQHHIVATGKDLVWVPQNTIIIINYELIEPHHEALSETDWDLIIVDEAHYLKNTTAKRTKLMLRKKSKKWDKMGLCHCSKRVIFLTGTPLLNRPVEFWPLANFCAPDDFFNWRYFVNDYCGGSPKGSSNTQELQTKLRKLLMVRRLKKDVLTELPAKSRQVIEMPCSPKLQAIIDAEMEEWNAHEDDIKELEAKAKEAKVNKNEEKYRDATRELTQARFVAFSRMAAVRRITAIAKLPLCIAHIKLLLESVDKLVIFCHHHGALDGLAEALASYNPVCVDGRVTKDARQEAVDKFQDDPEARVFIGGIKAAGVGITLTAASTVVFVELDWTPGINTQAEDRLHRIGQEDQVLVQHLVLEGSLDAKIAKDCVEKQEVIDNVLDKEEVA